MTKAEALDKAAKLAMKGDLALYDEILHPDYESMNQRVRINREMSKSILSENGPLFTVGPMQKIYENEEFACIHRFSRIANKDVFYEVLTAITYKKWESDYSTNGPTGTRLRPQRRPRLELGRLRVASKQLAIPLQQWEENK